MGAASKAGAPCPTENLLAAQVGGQLPHEESERIGNHIDECDACREVMIALRARPSADPLATTNHAPDLDDTVPLPPLLPTAFLDRYELKRELGSGGMGVVYEALDLNLHRVVALKVLKHQQADAATRLVREARAMATLSHRNVVTVYDVGIHDQQVFVAMQLIEGHTLRDWVAAAPRSVSQILRVVCDAGAGLAAAHAAGLIHRDFKPDNVLVSRSGTPRVTDFGLARRTDLNVPAGAHTNHRSSQPKVEIEDASVTRSGAIIGTPAYMAPEQATGQTCDARADQFSFCVTAWEALFGNRPFSGTTWSDIYGNVVSGTIVEPPTNTAVSRLTQRALRRGMVVDPAGRFLNMRDLLEVLETGIAKPTPWIKFAAIAVASAALAGAIVWIAKDHTTTPTVAHAEPAHAEPLPPPKVSIAPIVTSPVKPLASDTAPIVPPAPGRHHKVKREMVSEPTQPSPPTTPATTGMDNVRAQRAALDQAMHQRGLRTSDLTLPVTAALAAADGAIRAGDVGTATEKIVEAKQAIATIAIDRAFIDRKLGRLNHKLHGTGHAEELKPLYKQLAALVQNEKFAEANTLIDEMADRFADR